MRLASVGPLFYSAQSICYVIQGHCLWLMTIFHTVFSFNCFLLDALLVQKQWILLTTCLRSATLSLNPIYCRKNIKYQYNGCMSVRRWLNIMSVFLSMRYGSNKLLMRRPTYFVMLSLRNSSVYSMYQFLSVNMTMSTVPHRLVGLYANRCLMCIFLLKLITKILYCSLHKASSSICAQKWICLSCFDSFMLLSALMADSSSIPHGQNFIALTCYIVLPLKMMSFKDLQSENV